MSDLHDLSDDRYWRSMPPRDVLALVEQQLDEVYADYDCDRPDALEVVKEVLQVVGLDAQDRAVDQFNCGKVDPCRAKAAFLAWLAWHLDDAFFKHFAVEGR